MRVVQTRAPVAQQPMHGLGAEHRLGGDRQRDGSRMNGCVCDPPIPPWNEMSSSNAQPSSATGS
jgi:hypothetical protein